MKSETRSILEELNSLRVSNNTPHLIENKALNIIQSAINLISLIHETYNEEDATDLERRLISSIKSADSSKFKRGLKRANHQ